MKDPGKPGRVRLDGVGGGAHESRSDLKAGSFSCGKHGQGSEIYSDYDNYSLSGVSESEDKHLSEIAIPYDAIGVEEDGNDLYFRSEAKDVMSHGQYVAFLSLLACVVFFYLILPGFTTTTFIVLCTIISFCSSGFKLWLFSLNAKSSDICGKIAITGALPRYSILIPLFKESQIIEQLILNISKLQYSHDKLQVLLILENDDKETIKAIADVALPHYFSVIRVPYSEPRTKAKACNYAMRFVTGEYTCIYDAEDEPDPDQLLKVLNVFAANAKDCACVQARLNFYNAEENILAKMFSLEYRFVFDYMLPALQKVKYPIPLGGSSNHFRTDVLKKILWDPYNLTEDAELGIQLIKKGYAVFIVDSYTMEEAPINFIGWYRQRSRWIKGYVQTYLVYSRDYISLLRLLGYGGFFAFHCILILGNFLLAMSLCITIMLSITGITSYAVILLTVNISVWYIISFFQGFLMSKQDKPLKKFSRDLTYGLLFPVYLVCQILPCIKALFQLITKPHYWEKTVHGLSKVKKFERT